MSTVDIPHETDRGRPSALVLAIRVIIVLVAVAALASPVYVAMRASHFLNQPPPPFWGVNVGTGGAGLTNSSAGGGQSAGLGGC
ncbi:MAG TPA: hypothetical protein VFO01_18940 [Trebonia sp.]|nr:hypothetical protein [Trebonia sp.]